MRIASFVAAVCTLVAPVIGAQESGIHSVRRAAALKSLGERLLLVPTSQSFMADDQPGFKEATDFYYFTGVSDLVGGVLAIDGISRRAVLFAPEPNPLFTRRQVSLGSEEARRLQLDAVLPIDSLEPFLRAGRSWRGILVSPTDQ